MMKNKKESYKLSFLFSRILKLPILLTCILFLTSCAGEDATKIVLLKSNLIDENSELIYLNNNLDRADEKKINQNGFEKLLYHKEGFVSISPINSKIAYIQDDNLTMDDSNFPYPLHALYTDEKEIYVYNFDFQNDINYYTYEFINESTTNHLRIKGIPISMTFNDKNAFIYTRDMSNELTEEQFSLIVLDLDTEKVVQSFPINKPTIAFSLVFDDGVLYAPLLNIETEESSILTLNVDNWNLEINELRFSNINDLLIDKNKVFTFHSSDNGSYIVESSKSLEASEFLEEFDFLINNPKINGNKLYTIKVKADNTSSLIEYDLIEKNLQEIDFDSHIIDYLVL